MIDLDGLRNAIISNLDERILDKYDFDSILRTVKPCWDDTAVMVTANDFVMVFDKVGLELLDYTGYDA